MAKQKAIILKETTSITAHIIKEFKDTNRAEIKKWRQALSAANDPDTPRTAAIQDLFDNLKSDGHLISQMNIRKAATLAATFSIINKQTREMDIIKTDFLQKQWFFDLLGLILDSVFFGYSVVELQDPISLKFKLIPRRNVVGVKNMIYFEAYGDSGIDINEGYENYLLKIGKEDSMGLLADLCGLLIWKRNAQQSWAEFTEKFGMPLISATTNKTSQADIKSINTMLRALGEAATAVLPEGTNIKIEQFTGGDYKLYDQQIERINGEIGKPITGGTMVSDNGSSRSQSEVHERNLDEKIAIFDRMLVQFTINDQLIPMLGYWGYDFNPEIDQFVFDKSFELTMKEYFDVVDRLLNRYDIPYKWISDTFNIPIDGVKEYSQQLPLPGQQGNMSANFQ